MKLKFCLLLLLTGLFILIGKPMMAQSNNTAGLYFGGGLNNIFTDANSLAYEHTNYMFGLSFGAVYSLNFKNNINIDIGLGYDQKGYKDTVYGKTVDQNLTPDYDSDYGMIEWKINYISLPVLIGYNFGCKFSVTPQIGVFASNLINGKVRYPVFENDKLVGYENSSINKSIRPYDFGYLASLKLNFHISNALNVFARSFYRASLVSYTSHDYDVYIDKRHYGMNLIFGVCFTIKN
ncbi:MAG: outer membrane beta-barrel protein [Bacteroidales bacterium]